MSNMTAFRSDNSRLGMSDISDEQVRNLMEKKVRQIQTNFDRKVKEM